MREIEHFVKFLAWNKYHVQILELFSKKIELQLDLHFIFLKELIAIFKDEEDVAALVVWKCPLLARTIFVDTGNITLLFNILIENFVYFFKCLQLS